jgi:hypothetical protein
MSTGDLLVLGQSGWMLVIGWMMAFAAAILCVLLFVFLV